MADSGKPLQVIMLGTGGPRPDPKRHGPATLIQFGDEYFLFDAGRGVVLQLLRAGIALSSIKRVFITHHHYDHIGDLHDVILSTWLEGRRGELAVFGPPDTKRIVNALLSQVYDKDIEFRVSGEPAIGGWKPVNVTDVVAGLVLEGHDWSVYCDYVVHGHGLPLSAAFRKRWVCLGYRFESTSGVVAISGDSVDCAGLDRLCRSADLLVQCCYLPSSDISNEHWKKTSTLTLACGDSVGKIASKNNVKALVLTHRRHSTGQADRTLEDEVRHDYSGQVVVANDLTAFKVC